MICGSMHFKKLLTYKKYYVNCYNKRENKKRPSVRNI